MYTKTKALLLCSMLAFCSFFSTPASAGFTRPIIFPVQGGGTFTDDFGDGRSGGRVHLGNDIMAPKHTPVLAVVDGTIHYAPELEPSYGWMLSLRDSEGYEYKYIHLNNDTPGTDDGNGGISYAYAPDIRRGSTVRAGQIIGYVGDSGNAESTRAHLHFEIHTPGDTPINPYESLLAARNPGEPEKSVREIPSGILIKYPGDATVYLLADQVKYAIANEQTVDAIGMSLANVRTIPLDETYRSGLPIEASPSITFTRGGTPLATTAATQTAARQVITQDLRLGSRGPQVVELQSILKRLGYFSYPTLTGYYGTATRDGVLKFQRAKGIDAVGYVGPKTRAALNAS